MFNESFILLALFPTLLVYMIDYGFGNPGDSEKWSPKELLSGYSYFIATLALVDAGKWFDLYNQLKAQIAQAISEEEKKNITDDFKRMVFKRAYPLFTWEKAIGMCPICFHFWVAIIFNVLVNIFYFDESIITFTMNILVGHFFIRLLKKYF